MAESSTTDQASTQVSEDTAVSNLMMRPAAGRSQEPTPDSPALPQRQYPAIIIEALRQLLATYERQCDRVRRNHLRRMLEGEEFWKGNHYPIWSESAFTFRTPFEQLSSLSSRKPENMPTRVYVTNLFRAHGASVIAAISEKLPKVRFLPKSADSQEDIATAKAASTIAELIERNNDLSEMLKYEAYLLWTQGLFGAYVRFVLDEEFGQHDEPILEETTVEIAPDRFLCGNCGGNTPANEPSMMPAVSTMSCPSCGSLMKDSDFYPAEYGQAPVMTGSTSVPDGQEVISLFGGVHIKVMPWARTQRDTGYIILSEEQPIGRLRASHPWVADKIREGAGESQEGASNTYEHLARQRLYDAGQPYGNRLSSAMSQGTCTYKRVWFRPEALHQYADPKIRAALVELFPTGAFCSFAGETFLEAREENLDDHWQLCTAMPSQGLYADALGHDTIPMNKVIDDNLNLMKEQMEFGAAPPVAVDARYINAEALTRKRMRAGSYLPVVLKRDGGKSLRDMFWQPTISIDGSVYGHTTSLIELTQLISAALPTIFGGGMPSNETASGYSQARSAAMGRLQMFWNSIRSFHAKLMLKSVNVFRKSRTEDAQLPILDASKDYVAQYIRLSDLNGNIVALPEANEDFPASWAEKREYLMQLVEKMPEWAQAILGNPANSTIVRRLLADPDVQLPTEANREKQLREIHQMLKEEPIPVSLNLDGSVKFKSSVPVDLELDDHDVQAVTIAEWGVSDKGITAKKDNPAGYANVLAHWREHMEAKAQLAAELTSMMAGVQQAYGIDEHSQVPEGEEGADAPKKEGSSEKASPAPAAPPAV